MRTFYWSQTSDQVMQELNSNREGLSSLDVSERLIKFGANAIAKSEPQKVITLIWTQFSNPLVWILIFAMVVSIAVKQWTDALVVLTIILASALLGFVQEFRASKAIEKLLARIAFTVTTIRNGKAAEILATEIVPGDIVLLNAGTMIPADGILIESKDLFVNQSALTGESMPVEKHVGVSPPKAVTSDQMNCVFMGTSVRSGTGTMIVVNTGLETHFGKISGNMEQRHPATDFERGLRSFGALLTKVMILFVFIIALGNFFLHKPILESFLFAIALAVGLSPELLPMVLTVTLSKGAVKMSQRGILVRRLNSIETFGSMDVLCCDKTGTLTKGEMVLENVWDQNIQESKKVATWAGLNAYFQTGIKNPLDDSILASNQVDKNSFESYAKVDEIAYDFLRKRLTVVVKDKKKPDTDLILTKGAVANILDICSALDQNQKNKYLDNLAQWGSQGLRVIGLAYKECLPQKTYGKSDEVNLTFAGFLLFRDPPHPDAKDALTELKKLGVGIKVITGDNRFVAKNIASAVGIDNLTIMTGAEIETLSDIDLIEKSDKIQIFVEVDPQQKERLVDAFKKQDHIVGFLGDGINDAPALNRADVGISVESAVDVAKEAADLVLIKHNLDYISQGIILGRETFANTLKYIFITVSANFGNMLSMALSSFFLPFLPLLAKQILLNNFLCDLPSLTIGSDRVDDDWERTPHRWNIKDVRKIMIGFGLVSSMFDGITFFSLLFVFHASPEIFRTGWFVESVLAQILIIYVVRTYHPIFLSKPGRGLVLIGIGIFILALGLPYLAVGEKFALLPLPSPLLGTMVGISLVYMLCSELLKHYLFPRIQESVRL